MGFAFIPLWGFLFGFFFLGLEIQTFDFGPVVNFFFIQRPIKLCHHYVLSS